jgi:ribosome-binding factor A
LAKYRGDRINEEIRRVVSSLIQNDIKDPRLSAMVSVTRVDVTKDLRYAKVFVSIFGKDDEKASTLNALKNSAGFIRKEIGHKVNLRYTPEIIIEVDNSIEHGMHIDELFQAIKGKEQKNE